MLKLENTKKALFTLSAVMAILSILISFLFQKEISEFFFKNSDYNNSVVWLGAGVALSVFSSAQIALLNGLGKIKILAILTIINSFVSLTFGVIFLNLWGKEGLLFFILVGPAANFLVGGYFTNRIKYSGNDKSEKKVIFPEIKKLLHMGIGLMLIGVAWSIAHLMIRATIQDKLGVIELGYFQASWTVGTFYLSFILNGLGSDYY
jgi:PST family polysaccharide transporter